MNAPQAPAPAARAGAGRYFEEFDVGDSFVTPGRTLTETDLMTYAYLSGDHNPLHTDIEFAKASPWGGRLAYGLLVTVIAAGLRSRLGLLDGTALALMSIECRFTEPVFIGDTLKVRMTVIEKKASRHADRGVVVFNAQVLNQAGVTVQEGRITQLVRCRPQQKAQQT